MNKQKGLAPVLVVLLIAVAVGGYLIFKTYLYCPSGSGRFTWGDTCHGTGVLLSLPNPVSSTKVSDSAETANWKTYTSSRYKFSLKYPTNITYTEREFERVWKVSDSEPASTKQEVETTFNVGGGTLIIVGNKGGMGIEPIKSLDVIVGGKKTAKFYRSETNGVISAIPSPKGEYIYFDFNLPDSSPQREEADQTIDLILSTFKFTQ